MDDQSGQALPALAPPQTGTIAMFELTTNFRLFFSNKGGPRQASSLTTIADYIVDATSIIDLEALKASAPVETQDLETQTIEIPALVEQTPLEAATYKLIRYQIR